MEDILPLDRMTTADKLRALTEIWDDLCRSPEDVPSRAWHGEVLRGREERVGEGAAEFADWSRAKQEIRDAAQ